MKKHFLIILFFFMVTKMFSIEEPPLKWENFLNHTTNDLEEFGQFKLDVIDGDFYLYTPVKIPDKTVSLIRTDNKGNIKNQWYFQDIQAEPAFVVSIEDFIFKGDTIYFGVSLRSLANARYTKLVLLDKINNEIIEPVYGRDNSDAPILEGEYIINEDNILFFTHEYRENEWKDVFIEKYDFEFKGLDTIVIEHEKIAGEFTWSSHNRFFEEDEIIYTFNNPSNSNEKRYTCLARFDGDGKHINSKIIRSNIADEFTIYEILRKEDGNFIAMGYIKSEDDDFKEILFLEIDENFDIVWEKKFINSIEDISPFYLGMNLLPKNNMFAIYGNYHGSDYDINNRDIVVTLFDMEGNLINNYVYDNNQDRDEISKVFETDEGNVMIAGLANRYKNIYLAEIDMDIVSVNDNIENDRISISPNPVDDYILINPPQSPFGKGGSELTSRGITEVIIYNVLGEKMISLSQSERELRIDVSHLTPGIYFIKIGDRVEKFVKE